MPACRSMSTQSAAIAMLGARVRRSMGLRRFPVGGPLGGPLRIAVEAPRVALERDAAPDRALLRRRHLGPALHFVEQAPAALALGVALAGGTDRDARGVGLGVVPG